MSSEERESRAERESSHKLFAFIEQGLLLFWAETEFFWSLSFTTNKLNSMTTRAHTQPETTTLTAEAALSQPAALFSHVQ